ncbi:DNA cytosine methyltransferase [Methanofollis tationis]|uniref:DNA (cytosine-5-)-methyltransferase n=1 Tax=Methanofollis tationis TaxID=81417 RepID=A0A7K4HKM0_9EURY|nr:DNA cytosine methyltransferase [Methanofollis tationis]NVO65825.1 DNA cytosine methyltransferase [Methanofollis tationis]
MPDNTTFVTKFPQTKFNVISLFSGAMGLDLGLECTGRFEIIACVEKEKVFCDTIRLNQEKGRLSKDLKIFEGDIRNISPQEILDAVGLRPGEVDLIAGGPPCQSFSTAGKRGTVQDPRGTLLWEYLRFIKEIQPRFFLMENVRGLMSAALRHRPIAERPENGGAPLEDDEQPGSVVRLFAEDLKKINGHSYCFDCFEVNAVNYGAPQIRERVLFIGNRYNTLVNFPDPTHGSRQANYGQSKLPGPEDQELKPWKTLRDAIGYLKEEDPVILDFSPRKKYYLSKVPEGSNWRSLPIEDQKESMGKAWYAKGGRSGWWRRLSYDLPCPTLLTMPNHASMALCHPQDVRTLTLREYARIQEFPDDWELVGTVAQQYAQVGNAVPVRLGKVAGEVIVSYLEKLKVRDWQPYPARSENFKITYIQSHVRTRQWYKKGETIVWEDGKQNGGAKYSQPKTKRKNRSMS